MISTDAYNSGAHALSNDIALVIVVVVAVFLVCSGGQLLRQSCYQPPYMAPGSHQREMPDIHPLRFGTFNDFSSANTALNQRPSSSTSSL